MVDQAIDLLGRPLTVTASVRADRADSRIADAFDLALEFQRDGRKRACAVAGFPYSGSSRPRFVAHGVNGSFVKSGVDGQQAAVTANAHVVD